jgi:catechol 2,3-dioxygenase-like lactoylglutathione lyase family enzyme
MLRIREPKRSLRFYVELMGMRVVFTMNTGEFTVLAKGRVGICGAEGEEGEVGGGWEMLGLPALGKVMRRFARPDKQRPSPNESGAEGLTLLFFPKVQAH